MRFVSFQSDGGIRPGVLVDESSVLDIRRAAESSEGQPDVYRSVLAVIEAGERGLAAIDALLANPHEESVYPLADLNLLAPLPRPQQIRDFANYENHCLRAMDASMRLRSEKEDDPASALERMRSSGAYTLPAIWFEIPLYYKGNRFATNGHEGDVEWPPYILLETTQIVALARYGRLGENTRCLLEGSSRYEAFSRQGSLGNTEQILNIGRRLLVHRHRLVVGIEHACLVIATFSSAKSASNAVRETNRPRMAAFEAIADSLD